MTTFILYRGQTGQWDPESQDGLSWWVAVREGDDDADANWCGIFNRVDEFRAAMELAELYYSREAGKGTETADKLGDALDQACERYWRLPTALTEDAEDSPEAKAEDCPADSPEAEDPAVTPAAETLGPARIPEVETESVH